MRLGLLGKDISYSQSPKLFHHLKTYTGMDLTYELFDVSQNDVKNYIQALKEHRLDGLQVTKPYKTFVVSFCDALTEAAKQIGSVNTLYVRNQQIIGDNTDAYGFEQLLNASEISIQNKTVCIFGNGGAAKAVYHVLENKKISPVVYKRTQALHEKQFPIERNYEDASIRECQIIIQATSHDFDQADILHFQSLGCQPEMVIELMYHKKTNIMHLGHRSMDGKWMLIYQAIRSFEKFSNQTLQQVSTIAEMLKGVL